MSNKKLSQETLERLEAWCKSIGKYEYFKEIEKAKTCKLRQSGKFMYILLRLGYSPIEIDQLLDIRVKTIERRILSELKNLDFEKDTYDDYVFLFEKVSGFPYVDIYKLYIRSDLSENEFAARECIDIATLRRIKEVFSTNGANKYKNQVYQKRLEIYQNYKSTIKNRNENLKGGKINITHINQIYKLA